MEKIAELLKSQLFSGEDDTSVYAILDGASVPGLVQRLFQDKPEYECLYRGELAPDMQEVAPYLVRLAPDSDFSDWVAEKGWGNHWGVFVLARADLRMLRQHFRRFLMVHTQDARPLYFRYYDPRVLRVYLPACNSEELKKFFGPVAAYVLEDEKPDKLLRFEVRTDALVVKRIQE